jgi:aspartate aminotransferase
VASPGDEILSPEPLYTNYRSLAQVVGVTIVPITTRPEDGYHLPPLAEIEKKIGPRTRALLLCNPNNPTGTVYSEDELEQVAALVRKHQLFWISDEVYREFVYEEKPARSALSFGDLRDRTVVVDSISKRYSACGARVGCIVSHRKDFMEACLRMAQARLSSPTFGQVLTAAARHLPPGYFDSTRVEYKRRRDTLHHGLNSIPGVFSRCPEGAFYTMARLPVDDAETFASWLLTDFSHENRTVLVAPAAGFYMTPGLGRDEVRIAYVLKASDLEGAIEVLRHGLSKYPGRRPAASA